MSFKILIFILIAALFVFSAALFFRFTRTRASLIALTRIGWMLPLVFTLFPKNEMSKRPKSLAKAPLNVFLDDSNSMKELYGYSDLTLYTEAQNVIENITKKCVELGCQPNIQLLSDLDPDKNQNRSRLSLLLPGWLSRATLDPWIILSDGGDFQPQAQWPVEKLRQMTGPKNGLLIGFDNKGAENVWLPNVQVSPLAFEGKTTQMKVVLARKSKKYLAERLQIQVSNNDQVIASNSEAMFAANEKELSIDIVIPALQRGAHLLKVAVLPSANETHLWDNTKYINIEVMPNTVGVLHLLGSPSWDGRFLRRYLKSEPKYDLVSFYILRDPRDSNFVNERELSLIPFPVERLFNEELSSFKILIIQNFALFQFLSPEYQKNLVEFVKKGGALFFIGGPRSLTQADLNNSPLKEIFPFDASDLAFNQAAQTRLATNQLFSLDLSKRSYKNTPFKIEFAEVSPEKRALVNVHDDWKELQSDLGSITHLEGLNEFSKTRADVESTFLLLAKDQSNRTSPLAVATYPGQGRALWLLTDSIWRLVMSQEVGAPRRVYDQFVHAAMTWLLRQEFKRPIQFLNANLSDIENGQLEWSAHLNGSILPHLRQLDMWKINVCGIEVDNSAIEVKKLNEQSWLLDGKLSLQQKAGAVCRFEVKTFVDKLGSDRAEFTTIIPESLSDNEVGAMPEKIHELANILQAPFYTNESKGDLHRQVNNWMLQLFEKRQEALGQELKVQINHYWAFDQWWIWLCLLFLPLEVLLRKKLI